MGPPFRHVVPVEPLTVEAFAPFGQVFGVAAREGGIEANLGTARRADWVAAPVNLRPGARANVAVFRSRAQRLPLEVAMLERHPYSSQLFSPMSAGRYLVCVAPSSPDGEPDLPGLRAFLGASTQGINYLPGVWHHPLLALEADAQLLMLAFEDGSAGDCEVRQLPGRIQITAGMSSGASGSP